MHDLRGRDQPVEDRLLRRPQRDSHHEHQQRQLDHDRLARPIRPVHHASQPQPANRCEHRRPDAVEHVLDKLPAQHARRQHAAKRQQRNDPILEDQARQQVLHRLRELPEQTLEISNNTRCGRQRIELAVLREYLPRSARPRPAHRRAVGHVDEERDDEHQQPQRHDRSCPALQEIARPSLAQRRYGETDDRQPAKRKR